jgi:hypothetical protein
MAEKSIDRHVVVEFSWVGPANDWLARFQDSFSGDPAMLVP